MKNSEYSERPPQSSLLIESVYRIMTPASRRRRLRVYCTDQSLLWKNFLLYIYYIYIVVIFVCCGGVGMGTGQCLNLRNISSDTKAEFVCLQGSHVRNLLRAREGKECPAEFTFWREGNAAVDLQNGAFSVDVQAQIKVDALPLLGPVL